MGISKEQKKVLSILITLGLIGFIVSKAIPHVGQTVTRQCDDVWIAKDVSKKYRALPKTLSGQEILKKVDYAIQVDAISEKRQEFYIKSYVETVIRNQNGCEINKKIENAFTLINEVSEAQAN